MLYRDLQTKLRDLYEALLNNITKLLRKTTDRKHTGLEGLINKALYRLGSPYTEQRIGGLITLIKNFEIPSLPIKVSITSGLDYLYIQHIIEYIAVSETLQSLYLLIYDNIIRPLTIEFLLANVSPLELYMIDKTITKLGLYCSKVAGFSSEVGDKNILFEIVLEHICPIKFKEVKIDRDKARITACKVNNKILLRVEVSLVNNVYACNIARLVKYRGEVRLGVLTYELLL